MADIGTLSLKILTASSGTYTPTTGMINVLGIAIGGGGGGGGGINTDSAGGGGSGAGTCIRLLTAADIGASKAYVVATTGQQGTTLDGGTLLSAQPGNAGSAGSQSGVLGVTANGGAASDPGASHGDLNITGMSGAVGVTYSGTAGQGGKGGSTPFGFGSKSGGNDVAGVNGQAYGGGASGGNAISNSDRAGGTGAAGVLFMLEFIAAAASGRTTKNTRAYPLGVEIGMDWRS